MALKDHYLRNKKFLKDNFILFISIFVLNVFGYAFHFYVGRKLGPGDYGIFGSLLSLIYFIAVPMQAIQTSITKYVSTFRAKGEFGKITFLFKKSLKKMLIFSIGVFIIFLLLIPLISSFMKIDAMMPLFVLGIFLFFSLLLPIARGVLQGMQKFKLLGMSFISEGVFKLISGILLVSIGFGVSGAIGGFTISYAFALFLTIYFLAKQFKIKEEGFKSEQVYKYAFPVLIMLLSLTGIFTIDLVLVKHFFDEVSAGYYAALSLLGKVIFFGTMSISMVMFPKVAESYAANTEYKKILYKSLILVCLFAFCVTGFYFLFPIFTINMLFGSDYFAISNLLGLFAVFMSLFSLTYVLAFYNASIRRIKYVYILIFFNILELGLLWIFHESLLQVVLILLGLVGGLFISLLFYTFFTNERPHNSHTSI